MWRAEQLRAEEEQRANGRLIEKRRTKYDDVPLVKLDAAGPGIAPLRLDRPLIAYRHRNGRNS